MKNATFNDWFYPDGEMMIKRIRIIKNSFNNIILRYTFLFILSCIVVFAPFLFYHKTFVSFADGFNQYFPVYVYTGRYLRHLPSAIYHTHQIPQFDFTIGFGEDIVGTLNYYGFGSIFNMFSAFVPAQYAYVGYSFTILLKLYLAGLSFSLFARNRVNNDVGILTGMFLYAFQGYALYYSTIFYSFGDVLVFFPLCLLGADFLVDRDKKMKGVLLLSFSVCCTALSGFYFLYMASVAVIFYFFFVITRGKNVTDIRKCFLRGVGAYFVGLFMSGIILLPSLYSFLHSSRTSHDGQTIIQYLLTIPDWTALRKQLIALCLPQYEDGLGIPVVCIVLFIWALLFKKKRSILAVFFLILASFVPMIGSMMNGFSYSTNRQEFVIYFAVALEITVILDSCTCNCGRRVIALLCLANVSLCGLLFNMKWVINFRSPQNTYQEICNSTLARFTYLNQNSEDEEFIDRLDIHDTSLGGSLVLNSTSTSSYFSISNGYLYDFFRSALISPAIRGATFCLRGLDGRQSLESLLSVRYFSRGDNGDETIENEFQLPFGTVFTETVAEEQVQNLHPLSISSMFSHELILNEGIVESGDSEEPVADNFRREDIMIKMAGIDSSGEMMHVKEGGKIEIIPEEAICADREYYIYIRGLKYEEKQNETEVRVGKKNIVLKGIGNRAYIGDLSDYLVKIEEDTPYTLQFEQPGSYTMESVELLSVNTKKYQTRYWELINNGCLYNIKKDGNMISGTVNAKTDGYLFLSIPYSEGWKCLVDNKTMKLLRTDYAFMSVPVTMGEHEIVLQYHSPWMLAGECMSILGWIIWLMLWMKENSELHLQKQLDNIRGKL